MFFGMFFGVFFRMFFGMFRPSDTPGHPPDLSHKRSLQCPIGHHTESRAATAATAGPPMRQLTVMESFRRRTRHRTGDLGNSSNAVSDAPAPTATNPLDLPASLPPHLTSPTWRWLRATEPATEPAPRRKAAAHWPVPSARASARRRNGHCGGGDDGRSSSGTGATERRAAATRTPRASTGTSQRQSYGG